MKTRVSIILPDLSSGGAQVMVSRLASHINCNTVDAEVICVYGKEKKNDLEKAIMDHGIPICFIGKSKGFSLSAMNRLFKELDRFQPDVIHTHLSACVYCAPWVIVRKRKMLHTVHNMPDYELIRPKRMIMRALYKTGVAIPVAISAEIRAQVKAFYRLSGYPELIYNPVDVERYSSTTKQKNDLFTVLHIGRLSLQKNQQLLIQAFCNVYQANNSSELYILGDGPLRKELEELIAHENMEKHIHLEGNVTNTEDYYAKADVFAMSSEYEGLPLVVLEAMAASLPIVSTDVGGVKDLVKDNGILIPKDNCKQLSNALIEMMEHPEVRKEMGQRSYSEVQKYDSSVIADEYEELYRKYARS